MAGNARSGRRAEKPFRDALRMELAAAGEDSKALRQIARALIAQANEGKMDAIRELADRIDGKPAQEATLTIDDRRAIDLTDDELALIAAGSGNRTAEAENSPQVLN